MDSAWRNRPFAPPSGTMLCNIDQVPVDNGVELNFGDEPKPFRVVVFRLEIAQDSQPEVRAYVNECPHLKIEYGFVPGSFCVYEVDGRKDLMCPHHAAMFRLSDGYCYEGPCIGKHLIEVPVVVSDQQISIA